MNQQKPNNPMLDDEILYFMELEKEWEANNKQPNESELVEIFSESEEIISDNLARYMGIRKKLCKKIKKQLKTIKEAPDEMTKFFLLEWLKNNEKKILKRINNHISRLSRMKRMVSKEPPKAGTITDYEIQLAREGPLESIVSREMTLRRSGKYLIGLCPFHQEKTPSFTINTQTNYWRCYGCALHGDSIEYIKQAHGLSFREAVSYLGK